MSIILPIKIGCRYYFSRKSDKFISFISFFAALGLMLGVATLIIVTSVMRGFHDEFIKNVISLNSDVLIQQDLSDLNSSEIVSKLRKYDFVTDVIKISNNQALLSTRNFKSGIQVKGISIEDLKNKSKIVNNIEGNMSELGDTNIVLGRQMCNNMGIGLGSKIQLVSTNSTDSILGSIPKIKTVFVSAIFSSGMYDYDSSVAFINPELSEKLFGKKFNSIEVYTNNPDKSDIFIKKIKKDIPEIFGIHSWIDLNSSMINALKIERVSMTAILTLIILVSAFNIVSSLFILVKDKSKDIAILKTIGFKNYQITLIFMSNGFIIGFIGTLLGFIVGISFTKNINHIKALLQNLSGIKIFDSTIYLFNYLPVKINFTDILFIVSVSFISSIIAGIYPAMKASKLTPVDILRAD